MESVVETLQAERNLQIFGFLAPGSRGCSVLAPGGPPRAGFRRTGGRRRRGICEWERSRGIPGLSGVSLHPPPRSTPIAFLSLSTSAARAEKYRRRSPVREDFREVPSFRSTPSPLRSGEVSVDSSCESRSSSFGHAPQSVPERNLRVTRKTSDLNFPYRKVRESSSKVFLQTKLFFRNKFHLKILISSRETWKRKVAETFFSV